MKRIVSIFFMAVMLLAASAETLSSIDKNGSWYYLYNTTGKKYKSLSVSSVGDVKGWCGDFFVSQNGSWYYLYDADGRKYKSMSVSSVGEIIAVSGGTFTARNGSWIYTYDSQGKKISSRSAH